VTAMVLGRRVELHSLGLVGQVLDVVPCDLDELLTRRPQAVGPEQVLVRVVGGDSGRSTGSSPTIPIPPRSTCTPYAVSVPRLRSLYALPTSYSSLKTTLLRSASASSSARRSRSMVAMSAAASAARRASWEAVSAARFCPRPYQTAPIAATAATHEINNDATVIRASKHDDRGPDDRAPGHVRRSELGHPRVDSSAARATTSSVPRLRRPAGSGARGRAPAV